jgi:sugar lactone lactonase YvrE
MNKPFTLPLLIIALVCVVRPINAQDLPLKDILLPGEGWQLVGEGYKFTEAPVADADGNVYFADVPASKIYKIDAASGKISELVGDSGKTSGLFLGPDGSLFASQSGKQTIAKYDLTGKMAIVATEAPGNDLVVARDGSVYCTDSGKGNVIYISPSGEKRVVAEGIAFPNGLILSPDGGTLIVAEMRTDKLIYFRVNKDGSLSFKQPYTTLMIARGKNDSGADGLTVDGVGRVYVATHAGVQVIDTQGRVSGVIARPQPAFLSNVAFGGPEMDTLYATSADKVFKRKLNAKGFTLAK